MRIQRKKRNSTLMFHLMLIVPVVILFIYNVLPIPAGILMAFQNFQPGKGFLGSEFVGFKNFTRLWKLPDTFPALRNTLIIAICKIIGNLVIPIVFALLLNEIQATFFKRTVQTITYLPYFLSWVIVAGILIKFLSPGSAASEPGFLNTVLVRSGLIKEPIYFLGTNKTFRGTIIISDIWKGFGYNSIVYLAALTGIDPTLYEAAAIDGASQTQTFLRITLPLMKPVIQVNVTMAVISALKQMETVYLLTNGGPGNSTQFAANYLYQQAFKAYKYGYGNAIGVIFIIVCLIVTVLLDKVFTERESRKVRAKVKGAA